MSCKFYVALLLHSKSLLLDSTLLYLFYFNRVFAFLVSLAIRIYTWQVYKVYVSFDALQISLLAGRIFFKGARYHGENETVLINDGFITWRYWLRRVKDDSLSGKNIKAKQAAEGRRVSTGEQGGQVAQSELPCRIFIEVRGLEWYIYNRSPAYDAILQHRKTASLGPETLNQDNLKQGGNSIGSPKSSPSSEDEKYTPFFTLNDKLSKTVDGTHTLAPSRTATRESDQSLTTQPYSLPGFLRLFPIGFVCDRGAVVMGNNNVRSVLVAKFTRAKGQVATQSSRPEDLYRQVFDFDVTHPVVVLKPNTDFKETQLTSAVRAAGTRKEPGDRHTFSIFSSDSVLRRSLRKLRKLVPSSRRSVESPHPGSSDSASKNPGGTADGEPQHRWLGLSRYIDDDDDGLVEQERWKAIEYAKMETIIDSPQVGICVFWDVPGLVLKPSIQPNESTGGYENDINGVRPPDWGIDVRVGGGALNYGPWADRQRTDLQSYFFPTLYQNSTPATRLQKGQTRVATVFKLRIEIEAPTVLRIPTREESKDWKWKSQAMTNDDLHLKRKARRQSMRGRKEEKTPVTPEIRPAGWLDVSLARDTCFTNTMDLVASHSGYSNKVELDIKTPEISSSVNNGLLLRSKSATVKCDLSNPLEWSALRKWSFDITSPELELFLIRDHIFLLADLVSDWTSGPPGDYYTFVPFNYALSARLPDFRIYLNTNDSNIINNPSDINDNTFIVIWGKIINAKVNIPLKHFRPLTNEVTFVVAGQNGGFQLRVPPWNTQHTFLDNREIATLKDLRLDGSYNYYTSTSPTLTDTAFINVYGGSPTVHLYGFLIRYFIKFKDNYFGEDHHFQTLEEYQSQVSKADQVATTTPQEPLPTKLSNDLDVILTISTDDCCAMLPRHLYSARENIKLDIRSIVVDLRFTNYYMDLEVSVSPLVVSRGVPDGPQESTDIAATSAEAFVDGISIRGHRLFGLPPTEPTYVCNWDFGIGSVSGDCSSEFLYGFISSLQCIAFSFDDAENALPPLKPLVLHDVTFLRAKVDSVNLWVHAGHAAFLVRTETIKVAFSDWAGMQYSNCAALTIPSVIVAAVDAQAASRHKTGKQPDVITHAYIRTNVDVRQVTTKPHFSKDRQMQQDHINIHDARTQRTPWLVYDKSPGVLNTLRERKVKLRPTTMPLPPMPEPIKVLRSSSATSTAQSYTSIGTDLDRPKGRRSSFLSEKPSKQRSASKEASKNSASLGHRFSANKDAHRQAPHIGGSSTRETVSPDFRVESSSLQASSGFVADPLAQTRASGITFSSSYHMPHFQVLMIEPDIKNVPELPSWRTKTSNENDPVPKYETPNLPDNEIKRSALNASLSSGLAVYCTPKALHYLNELFMGFQAKDPVTLLDRLQMAAMTDVLAQRDRASSSKSTQLRFELPGVSLRFVDHGAFVVPNSKSATSIHYDFHASNLLLSSQSNERAINHQRDDGSHKTLFHVELDQVGLSATIEAKTQPKSLAKIGFLCTLASLWLAREPGLTGEIQIQSFQTFSLNREIEHLVSLATSTEMLSQTIFHDFQRTASRDGLRRQWLILRLNKSHVSLSDPLFLTSASYILRSADQHLRTSDSWKMISRLRYVQHSLSPSTIDLIRDECCSRTLSCPADAKAQVIASFKQWRSWDLSDVDASALIRNIYGLNKDQPGQNVSIADVKMVLKVAQIMFVVDPGPQQNHISLERLIISVLSNGPRLPASQTHTAGLLLHQRVVEVFIGSMAISLNWDILELAEDINKHLAATRSDLSEPTTPDTLPVSRLESIDLQAVLVIQHTSFSFASIHLLCHASIPDLRASFVVSGKDPNNVLFDFLMAAAQITSGISHQSRQLVTLDFKDPSVHASLIKSNIRAIESSLWKLGATCEDISLDFKEDIQGLIGVIDLVVADEVARIYRMTKSLGPAVPVENSTASAVSPNREEKFHIALLLGTFRISLAILPNLAYVFEGALARFTAQKSEATASDLIVDFDLKEQNHRLIGTRELSNSGNLGHDICSIPFTSVNGRLKFPSLLGMQFVSGDVAMETIALEASSLHNLALTLYQTEISILRQIISRDVESVRSHYRAITAPNSMVRPSNSRKKKQQVFSLSFFIAGLDIKTVAVKEVDKSATLQLHLGLISLTISNGTRVLNSSKTPDAIVGIQEARVRLERSTSFTDNICGEVRTAFSLHVTSKSNDVSELVQSYKVRFTNLEVDLYTETASVVVDILGHLQNRFKAINFTEEISKLRARRQLKAKTRMVRSISPAETQDNDNTKPINLFESMYSLELDNIQVSWIIGDLVPISPRHKTEDLVLLIKKVDLATKRNNAARLMIQEFQLQMVPTSQSKKARSPNSALLPELVFNVAYFTTSRDMRFAFQAVGKALDLRLTSQFILPANDLQRSIGIASEALRTVVASWSPSVVQTDGKALGGFFGNKTLSSVLMDVDFAGAVVYVQGKDASGTLFKSTNAFGREDIPRRSRYSQFEQDKNGTTTTLRAPGVALKSEYKKVGREDPSLDAEIRVDASENILHPTIVPLIMEITSSVQEIVGEPQQALIPEPKSSPKKLVTEDRSAIGDPTAILGDCRLNLGLRIRRQKFSLNCEPIARVAATAKLKDIYITINTVQHKEPDKEPGEEPNEERDKKQDKDQDKVEGKEQGKELEKGKDMKQAKKKQARFFAVFASFTDLDVSVHHVYSQQATGTFEVNSVIISGMNSKHVSTDKGINAILKFSPLKIQINAKQLQDFLLFWEIWVPPEVRRSVPVSAGANTAEPQMIIMQKYQQVAASTTFPWDLSICMTRLDIQVELGQNLGRSAFSIEDFWVSSKKTSNWEQHLCMGFKKGGIDSTGRVGVTIDLHNFGLRTSIRLPRREAAKNQTPLIQASIQFDNCLAKAAFDYQPFVVADIASLEFIMYNVRESTKMGGDRLVAIVNSDKVQMFGIATSASLALGLWQAIQRLIQEKRNSFENSVKDIEKYLYRKASVNLPTSPAIERDDSNQASMKTPIRLQTNVVVTIQHIKVGAFPGTFSDSQVFKLEAKDTSARFAVVSEGGKIRSGLGLTLGQLQIALSGVNRPGHPQPFKDMSVTEVIGYATGSSGGTLANVPRVIATMQTWQTSDSKIIEYIFKSSFEGDIDLGYNYPRYSYVNGMIENHKRALRNRSSKPQPQSAVQITIGPSRGISADDSKTPVAAESGAAPGFTGPLPASSEQQQQQKITAVLNVPQSKYTYVPLEPPVIGAPQLRPMGGATPPVEWVGLPRERLPGLTHQLVIVTLLGVAKEVEDAYSKILGSS